MFRRRDSEEEFQDAQGASQASSHQGSALGGSAPSPASAPYGQDLVGNDATEEDLVGGHDASAEAESPHAPSSVFTPASTVSSPSMTDAAEQKTQADLEEGTSATDASATHAPHANDAHTDNSSAFQLPKAAQPAADEAAKDGAKADIATPAASASAPLKKFTLADHLASQRSFGTGQKLSTPTPASTPIPTRKPESSSMFDDTKPEPSNDFAPNDRNSKRTLVVGLETFLKGEISNCDRVVVEGGVDANMGDVQSLVIASTGTFRGSATLENAEISGTFDGDLTVRGRLLINTTGKVTGKVTYGDIEVKRGGKILGDIHTIDEQVEHSAAPMSVAALV